MAMNKPFKTYYGGKESNGTYQAIINEIPPHENLIIPFAGNCAITRLIKPAAHTYINDIDLDVYHRWKKLSLPENYHLYNEDYRKFLLVLKDGNVYESGSFIYCDPPFLKTTRRSARDVYNYEISRKDHIQLLLQLKEIECNVAISAIQNHLYDRMLKNWRKVFYKNITRHGLVTECLYCNYNIKSGKLHDYNYLGKDFTDRQRIKRKISRWKRKLAGLDDKERSAIIESIYDR